MTSRLARLVRRLRTALQRWSPAEDRRFHDQLFAAQRYDPFTFAYPGYLTIRRFADHASARLAGASRALDLGCGPGEITCELARRHPAVHFAGIDHSTTAIERARAHAARLGLTNIAFDADDVERHAPQGRVDLVMLFDAFHHLIDPLRFVRRIGMHTDHILLIEPAGTWSGAWQRDLDFDWLPLAIDTIRARAAWQLGQAEPDAPPAAAAPDGQGRPVEQRYPVDDFLRFFDGFGLEVQGTIAGLEVYPPNAYAPRALADTFGRAAYDAMVALEDRLVEAGLDLHARHWVIDAQRGRPHALRTPRPLPGTSGAPPDRLQSAYDAEYTVEAPPVTVPAGARFTVLVRVRNRSWRTWTSDGPAPVMASYHWLDAQDRMVVFDGDRTPLPRPLAAGEFCDVALAAVAPDAPGRYTLEIDLVHEHVTWFTGAGVAGWRTTVAVGPSAGTRGG